MSIMYLQCIVYIRTVKNGGAVMKVSEVLEKANRGEGLTVGEIKS